MEFEIKEGLYYSEDHEWVRVEGGKAYVGISGYAAHHLGDIVFVELPEIDAEFSAGDNIGVIESVKAVADMHTPISGKVLEVNEELEGSPELLNQDPYGAHIVILEVKDEGEIKGLMDAAAYAEYVKGLD